MSAACEVDNPARVWRFWAKVIVGLEDECWLWTGAPDRKGYGQFKINAKTCSKAHIFSFVLHHFPVPKGLHVDHECNNPPCVNPKHLHVVTNAMNNARSNSPSALNSRKTHCVRGHPFDEANTVIGSDGARRCRQCASDRQAVRERIVA